MARKLRVQPNGVCFHVVSRIAHREFMFDETERDIVVELLRKASDFTGVFVVAYCIMSNHIHLLLFIDKPENLRLYERWRDCLEEGAGGVMPPMVEDQRGVPPCSPVLSNEELAQIRKCRQMSVIERYEMTEDELKHRLRNVMRPAAFENLMDAWTKLGAAELAAEHERALRKTYDLSSFMKILKQDISQYYNVRHKHTGALWEGRFRDSYIEKSLDPLTAVSTYIDLNPWRAKMCARPEEYKWSSFSAAVGGCESARAGYRFVYDANDDWSMVEGLHRDELRKRMDADTAEQEELEDALFTSGGIIGSAGFVAEVSKREKAAFPRERKTPPLEVGVGGKSLFALRWLNKLRK